MLKKKKIIQAVLKGELGKRVAAEALEVSFWSVDRYVIRFQQKGPEGLDNIKRGCALDGKR